MPRRADFYDGTDYIRQSVVIDKEFYQKIRQIADADMKRRLKAGDVMEMFFELALEHAGDALIAKELELLRRQAAPAPSNRDLARQIENLSEDKKAKIAEILKE
jgi:hypothetical protein